MTQVTPSISETANIGTTSANGSSFGASRTRAATSQVLPNKPKWLADANKFTQRSRFASSGTNRTSVQSNALNNSAKKNISFANRAMRCCRKLRSSSLVITVPCRPDPTRPHPGSCSTRFATALPSDMRRECPRQHKLTTLIH